MPRASHPLVGYLRIFTLLFVLPVAAHPVVSGAGQAEAHPGGAVLGQRVAVTVTREGEGLEVTIVYVAEIPAVRLLAESRTLGLVPGAPPDPAAVARTEQARLEEVGAGVALAWNGAPVPLEPVALEHPVADGQGGFRDLSVARRARVAGREGELRVVNRNFPDEGGFYATSFLLDGALVATTSNLASVRAGRLHENRHAAWVRDDTTRESWVRLREAAWWERAAEAEVLTARMEGLEALDFPTRRIGGIVGGALLVGGGVLGWKHTRRPG